MTTETYTIPPNPGMAPNYPTAASNAQIAAANRTFEAKEKAYQNYKAVNTGTKRQILNAVNDAYTSELEDPQLGYTKVTALELITHLVTNYGSYTSDDRNKNEEVMNTPWDSAIEPFEKYLRRIADCRAYAKAAGDPISDKKAVDVIIRNFEKTGEYPDYVKDWNKKAAVDQTYANLKTHFMEAEKERIRQLTMKDLGYAGATTNAPRKGELTIDDVPQVYKKVFEQHMLKMFGVDYCSTHGMGNAGHCGTSCTKKCSTHKEQATLCNLMGGSTKTFVRQPAGGRTGGRGGRGGRGENGPQTGTQAA